MMTCILCKLRKSMTDIVIENCMKNIKKYVFISNSDLIINPCASVNVDDNHFINSIKNLSATSLFYSSDISKTIHPLIEELDFLQVDFKQFDKTVLSGLWYDYVHIIGSPPDHAAIDFIKKCCEFADSISFILPYGLDDYFSEEYKLVFSIELPELSRSSHIKDRKVFQIWLGGKPPTTPMRPSGGGC
jgi:hypothetical protein